ncbi:MAG: hypothetical protein R2817_01135 [Flavobacteriales bacterium]
MTETEFRALSLQERVVLLRDEGEHLGSRLHLSHRVHLYRLHGFFCELWLRAGPDQVEWVEVTHHRDILSEYVRIDVKDLLR